MKKVAFVTGGTRGLGFEISTRLLKSGYRVYAGSRNPEKSLEGLVVLKLDVSSEKECKAAINKILKIEKRLDLLINNAGVNDGEINSMFGVNVFGPYFLIRGSLDVLEKHKGRVINITSLNGLVPVPNSATYSASKHAVEGLGVAWSYELEKRGVHLTNIAPGAIYNPDARRLDYKTLRDKFPLLKLLFPMVTREVVAEKVVSISQVENPPRRVVIGADANISFFLYRTFPGLWSFVISKLYK